MHCKKINEISTYKIMKKLIKILIISVSIFITVSFINKSENQLETGFYYLSESEENSELVSESDSDIVYAIERTPIITSNDFSNVKVSSKKFESTKNSDFKIIEITLKNKSVNKWNKILNRIEKTNESIVFIFENKVIIEKSIFSKNSLDNSKILLPINADNVENFIGKLNLEIQNHKLNKKKENLILITQNAINYKINIPIFIKIVSS